MHYLNAAPSFCVHNNYLEFCKTADSDSVGLGCMSNILCDDVAASLRTHYTREGTAPNLAVKCLPFQSPLSLRLSHLLKL